MPNQRVSRSGALAIRVASSGHTTTAKISVGFCFSPYLSCTRMTYSPEAGLVPTLMAPRHIFPPSQ
ncbi:hypothetical protein DSECCO2_547420 [anaerobic digester metagenome]